MSVERVLFQFGAGLATFLPRLLAHLFVPTRSGGSRRVKTAKSKLTEQERLAGCRDAVIYFTTAYGHIVRECMTREELEREIDNGTHPQDLAQELHRRMAAMPGVLLGVNTLYPNVEIKLPVTLRDHHCYIIGRSGSGKTNLIRNIVFQDLAQGGGIGIIAPEQELLTEEIMPYIPDERMDDVVYFDPSDTQSPIPFNPFT
jgi:hypothetical protein